MSHFFFKFIGEFFQGYWQILQNWRLLAISTLANLSDIGEF